MTPSRDVLVRVRDDDRAAIDAQLVAAGYVPTTQTAPGASPAMAVLDPELMGHDAATRLARAAEAFKATPFVLLAGPQERTALAAFVEIPTVLAIVARDAPERGAELALALSLFNHRAGFGLDKFSPLGQLGPSVARLSRSLVASLDRDALLEEVEAFLAAQRIRSRAAAFARDAIEELVTNAVYDAPTDTDGHRIYADTDRRHAVFLPESARPTLAVAVDGARVYAAMSDPHGSLEPATVRRYLALGLRGDLSDKAGGAGLGFARIYGLVDRLVVLVSPGARTEISFALDAGSPHRDAAARPTGLAITTRD